MEHISSVPIQGLLKAFRRRTLKAVRRAPRKKSTELTMIKTLQIFSKILLDDFNVSPPYPAAIIS
jgi:hypothetical protein